MNVLLRLAAWGGCAVLVCASAGPHALGQRSASARRHTAAKKAEAKPSTPVIKNVLWQPTDVTQGSPLFVTVDLEKPAVKVTGSFANKTLTFFRAKDSATQWYALAGNDVETQPGSYGLDVTAVLAGGKVDKTTKQIQVGAGNFTTGTVDVPQNMVEPDEEGKKQLALDERAKAKAYAHVSPAPLWNGDFKKPVNGKETQSFGESRILNEEKESLHRGTDYPVNKGTPVLAANDGVVVLAQPMLYEGNCVILDHGEKLFTIYMHLDKIDAKVGDKVKKGDRLGVSGDTGRVTGPHMHFGVRWNGAYLDPVKLLALTLPVTHEEKPSAEKKTTKRVVRRRR